VACVSINGSNRLGSNSLTECLVFGARAGRHAARYAAGAQPPDPGVLEYAHEEEMWLDALRRRPNGGERLAALRGELQRAMEAGAGIYRDETGLRRAARTIAEVKERWTRVTLADSSLTFNTELPALLELAALLDVAEAILHSGLGRRESRGAHQRTDHPGRDDQRFLSHSLAYGGDGGTPRVEYLPVTVTRWPPGERVYGR
jgi:fumarate reductase flavoprotein subunit